MRLIDADELREYMERHCEFCKKCLRIYEYLQGRCELCPMSQVYALIDPEAGLKTHDEAVQIHLEKRSDEERLSYMQGYKAGIEKGHKDMLGQRAIKGKWLWDQDGNKFCSNCRTGTNRETNVSVPLFVYCPYCGSDNRERDGKEESK